MSQHVSELLAIKILADYYLQNQIVALDIMELHIANNEDSLNEAIREVMVE